MVGTFDSIYLRADKRVCVSVKYNDYVTGDVEYKVIDVTNQLKSMYKNVKFNEKFIERIEKKILLTLGQNNVSIENSEENFFNMIQTFNKQYSPVIITPNNIKFGEPLKVESTIIGFKRNKPGNNFPLSGIKAECVIGLELPSYFNVTGEINIDVFNKECIANDSKTETAYVDVDSEFKFIYDELKQGKCNAEKFLGKNGKLVNKKEIYKIIAKLVLGKTIILEYDEYYGYTIWKLLILIIDENY